MQRLHEILNARRLALGWTYEEVHGRLEAYVWPIQVTTPSLAVVGHWFNGTRRPRKMEHLRGLCDVLDVSLDEAISGGAVEAQTGVEQKMLQFLRAMSDEDVEVMLAVASKMAARS